jgi:hypothetical protein
MSLGRHTAWATKVVCLDFGAGVGKIGDGRRRMLGVAPCLTLRGQERVDFVLS